MPTQPLEMKNIAIFDIQTIKWEHETHETIGSNLGYLETRRLARDNQPSEVVAISYRMMSMHDSFQHYEWSNTLFIRPIHAEVSDKTLDKLEVSRREFEYKAVHLKDSAKGLKDAFKNSTDLPVWASWGHYPIDRLTKDYLRVKAKNPFSARFINIKTLAGLRLFGGLDCHLRDCHEEVCGRAYDKSLQLNDSIDIQWGDSARRNHEDDLNSITDVCWWLMHE